MKQTEFDKAQKTDKHVSTSALRRYLQHPSHRSDGGKSPPARCR
jgi:hypothetical protein